MEFKVATKKRQGSKVHTQMLLEQCKEARKRNLLGEKMVFHQLKGHQLVGLFQDLNLLHSNLTNE